jgi:predicted acyltransferase
MGGKGSDQARIASLDQFRGYTVLGMLFVNFVGGFAAIHPIFKHHNTYCSYADTIMPHFFFAVGFAYRLTLLRRLQVEGARGAYFRVLRRNLGLILLGLVIYHLDGGVKTWAQLQELGVSGFLKTAFQREPVQTLVHIGLTAIWIMPVIAAGAWARILFAIGSGVLHWFLSYQFGYYDWVMHRPGIDGGPLGFLTWTIPMIAGSLAYDYVVRSTKAGAIARIFLLGTLLMALGYGLACLNLAWPPNTTPQGGMENWLVEPPFVAPVKPENVNIWTMSQRAGSVSYLTFGAGISLALYALFVLACDVGHLHISVFRTFGSNALAAYIIHILVGGMLKPFAPGDAPLWYDVAALALDLGICYLFVRHLEKNNLYLRL